METFAAHYVLHQSNIRKANTHFAKAMAAVYVLRKLRKM